MSAYRLDRFVRFPTPLFESLLRARLSGGQWRVLLWVIRHTHGWNRRFTPFTWYQMAKDIALDRAATYRAGKALLRAGLLVVANHQLTLQEDSENWSTTVLSFQRFDARQLLIPGMDVVKAQRKPVFRSSDTLQTGQRVRSPETTVLRRGKDGGKEGLKTSKDSRARSRWSLEHWRPRGNNHVSAGAAMPIPKNMTAFLKIDECRHCHRALPWEWVPAIVLKGKPLAGTGVWRSQLLDHRCQTCRSALEHEREERASALQRHKQLVKLLKGEKPVREFTFERYQVTSGNRVAFENCKDFAPGGDNLYLWGACGVGKTHLAYAVAKHCFEETLSVTILWASELTRKVRMKEPEQEQAVLDDWASVDMLVIDDLGAGIDTPFSRQILKQIVDARDFNDRAGLIVTSNYSLDDLAAKLRDDGIPSRLAGMCRAIELTGSDGRLAGKINNIMP